jgi:hypothetical protein
MPMALTVRSVSGLSTASDSQSCSRLGVSSGRRRRLGGSLPPSVMDMHHRDQRDAVADAVVDAA